MLTKLDYIADCTSVHPNYDNIDYFKEFLDAAHASGLRVVTELFMARTPPIPERCQWAIFLRNHDELTLEMHALLMSRPGSPVMYYGDEITDKPYLLTLNGRDFLWFRLMPEGAPQRLGTVAQVGA